MGTSQTARKCLTKKQMPSHPKHPFAPDFSRVNFHKFFAELLWLADAAAREPERFFVIQPSA